MLQHDTGILSAATAFGKTVVCSKLIAEKKSKHAYFVGIIGTDGAVGRCVTGLFRYTGRITRISDSFGQNQETEKCHRKDSWST